MALLRHLLNASEKRVNTILGPVGSALSETYEHIEDPSDDYIADLKTCFADVKKSRESSKPAAKGNTSSSSESEALCQSSGGGIRHGSIDSTSWPWP